jgi:hypothetical protein
MASGASALGDRRLEVDFCSGRKGTQGAREYTLVGVSGRAAARCKARA